MNFNTHYRYVDCSGAPEKFYSAGNNAVEGSGLAADATLSSESWEAFHTYGCYWINAREFDFYADDQLAGKVFAKTDVVDEPFARPMGINLVTETYNWAKPYPTLKQLNDDRINTSYYDWVRSYSLIPVDRAASGGSGIFTEGLTIASASNAASIADQHRVLIVYKTNEDRVIRLRLKDNSGTLISDESYTARSGYGKRAFSIPLDAALAEGTYQLTAELNELDQTEAKRIAADTKSFTR
jgi:beta-glucanase (GH16 family)